LSLPRKTYQAFLFDMDGTLLTSIAAAERVWTRWAQRHGLDAARFVPTIHGARAIDTIRRLQLPGVDPAEEADWVTREELIDLEGVRPIAGAPAFLRALPASRWAIVTSAPAELARRRLQAAGLDVPETLISADDVEHGKPDPSGYRLAASRLGVDLAQCLIFEDAAAGIGAAEAAGSRLVVISATHAQPMQTPHTLIPDYRALTVHVHADGLGVDGLP